MNPYDKRTNTVALRTTKSQYEFLCDLSDFLNISKSQLINLMIEISDHAIRSELTQDNSMQEYAKCIQSWKNLLYNNIGIINMENI